MDVIAVILMIVLALISAGSKKKKQGAKTGQTPPRPARAANDPRGAIQRAFEELSRQVEAGEGAQTPAQAQQAAENAAALSRAKAKALRKAEAAKSQAQRQPAAPAPHVPAQPTVTVSREGMSAFDGEGCVGGSMPHDHTEGESHDEHGRHVAAMQAREKAEAAVTPREVDARALRRAVVMAEILDRPVSLRARRRAG